jgi:hypothetical protein
MAIVASMKNQCHCSKISWPHWSSQAQRIRSTCKFLIFYVWSLIFCTCNDVSNMSINSITSSSIFSNYYNVMMLTVELEKYRKHWSFLETTGTSWKEWHKSATTFQREDSPCFKEEPWPLMTNDKLSLPTIRKSMITKEQWGFGRITFTCQVGDARS